MSEQRDHGLKLSTTVSREVTPDDDTDQQKTSMVAVPRNSQLDATQKLDPVLDIERDTSDVNGSKTATTTHSIFRPTAEQLRHSPHSTSSANPVSDRLGSNLRKVRTASLRLQRAHSWDASAVLESLEQTHRNFLGGISKLASFRERFDSEMQKYKAGKTGRDSRLQQIRGEITQRMNAAGEFQLQWTEEFKEAVKAEEEYEKKTAPFFKKLNEAAVKKEERYATALFELKRMENAEKELQDLPYQNQDLIQQLAERHLLQPFRDFMQEYKGLLKFAE